MSARALGLSLALALAATQTASADGGCGEPSGQPVSNDTQAWPSRQKLYYFDKQRRLVRSEFDGSGQTVVSEHALGNGGSGYPSPDGRYVAYTSEPGPGHSQLWRFDTVGDRERMLLDEDRFSIGIPKFSGDSRRLAVHVDARSERLPPGAGLHLFELADGKEQFLRWPPQAEFPLAQGNFLFPDWSAEGQVLIHLIGDDAKGERVREFWRYDESSRAFHRIEGDLKANSRETEFFERGKAIAIVGERAIPSDTGFRSLLSADPGIDARVDAQYHLMVRNGDASRIVATGSYNDCEGETLWLSGWVDGSRYLVFRLDDRSYLHDPRTGKTTPLFKDGYEARQFFWGPP